MHYKRTHDLGIFLLPFSEVLVGVAADCGRVIRALLMLTGDIELNPGSVTGSECKELEMFLLFRKP